jgi:hypothetical protein
MGETRGVMPLIWVRTKAEYFSIPGLTQFLKIRSDLPIAAVDRTPLIVIASEAKQSIAQLAETWIASSLRSSQ